MWGPKEFNLVFKVGLSSFNPTCVYPYELQVGSGWVSGGAQLGGFSETICISCNLPCLCLCPLSPCYWNHVKPMPTQYPCSHAPTLTENLQERWCFFRGIVLCQKLLNYKSYLDREHHWSLFTATVKYLYKVFCGSRGSCAKSDEVPRVMSVGTEDYKFGKEK